jgi:hypothetical protein
MRSDGLQCLATLPVNSLAADVNLYLQFPCPVEVTFLTCSIDGLGTSLAVTLKKGVAGTDFFTVTANAADQMFTSSGPIAGQSARVETGTVLHAFLDTTGTNTGVTVQIWGRVLGR